MSGTDASAATCLDSVTAHTPQANLGLNWVQNPDEDWQQGELQFVRHDTHCACCRLHEFWAPLQLAAFVSQLLCPSAPHAVGHIVSAATAPHTAPATPSEASPQARATPPMHPILHKLVPPVLHRPASAQVIPAPRQVDSKAPHGESPHPSYPYEV
jgi:hypothetical protein